MKVQELMMSIHNKDFNLAKRREVKTYLPIEVKKTIAQSILFDCTSEFEGAVKIDSVERYMSYVRHMITMHTNLEYTDAYYDNLCSAEYDGTTLLNAIMKCFEADATECSRILNLMTDDYMQEHSLENSVSQFLYGLNNMLGGLAGMLTEKVGSVDLSAIMPDDAEKLNTFLNQYIK